MTARPMNERIVERILSRVGHGIGDQDAVILRRMADYFDRASLRISADDGAPGDELELVFTDDANRYAVTLAELRELYHGLRRGETVDWSRLRSARTPTCDRA